MLADRIKKAIIFKTDVYREVAQDATFTNTAWIIVLIVELLNAFGTHASSAKGFFGWLFGSMIMGAVGLGAFALTCYAVAWLSTTQLHAPVEYKQLVRSLGLASIWQVIGFIGILSFIPFFVCITGPIAVLADLAGLVAYVFAIKETTKLEWGGTLICAVAAIVITVVVSGVFSAILTAIHLL